MKADYTMETLELGWLLCRAPGEHGLPADALARAGRSFPKNAVMAPGIAHHYAVAHPNRRVVIAVTTPKNLPRWLSVIEESLKDQEPLFRWWAGTDVGTSSAAIFAVLAPSYNLSYAVTEFAHGSTPRDAGDFGRCKRLIERFPEWKVRLPEVAAKYPDTHWPVIIRNWEKLVGATDEVVSEFLSKL